MQGRINDIPETVNLDYEQSILDARAAYDALSPEMQLNVGQTYLDKLLAAEYRLRVLKLPSVADIYDKTGKYLAKMATPGFGDEWRVIGLKRSGRDVSSGYYDNVVTYVTKNIDGNERLDANKSTENARLILALTALGYDVTDVAGHSLLAGLDKMTYIQNQGIEGSIWTLTALDSHNYKPSGDVTQKKLVQVILAAQKVAGGWGDTLEEPSVTAKAIHALAPYYSKETDVKTAVDKALTYLSGKQDSYGRFDSVEASAQVVVALTALGFDADTDDRFVKFGVSVLDALRTYAVDSGGFALTPGGTTPDDATTEQAYNALTAYIRLQGNKNSLYNMLDVTIQQVHYAILSGGDGTWNADDKTYTIVVNAPFAKFTGVKVDGTTIAPGNYDAEAVDNGTKVILRESYLTSRSLLSLGIHSITLVLKEASPVTTNLTITETDAVLAQKVEKLIGEIGKVTKDSKAKIDAARKDYDALTSAQKALVRNYSKLTAAEKTYAELTAKITVYFTLLGDSIHHDNGEVHTLAQGGLQTWISRKGYELDPGATVLDLFTKALGGKYSFDNTHGNYIASIDGLAEFTNGTNSGWMYTLNGTHPGLGVAQQKLSNGDDVVFHYTDDYTYEESGGNYGSLFGKLIPALSLLLVMVLRMIPNLLRKGAQITEARNAIGRGAAEQDTVKGKLGEGMTLLGALTSWALEGSVVTADSMRSRGYGSGKRSSFMIYTMTGLDWGLLAAQAVLLVGMIVLGDRTAAFTPVLNIAPIGGRNLPGFLCYLCYLLIPIALHIKEAIQWRISISKI